MVQLLSIAALGFFLGMRHATDPDHVLAVTTIVSGEKRIGRAAWIGALWGLGHTLTILVVGGAIILFGLVIPPRVGLTMEFSVAAMLIVLGLWNLSAMVRAAGEAGDHTHAHPTPGSTGPFRWLRPVGIGVVHGLAGSAGVALLVLATIRDPLWATAYLLVFGVGTVAGMMLVTMSISVPFAYTSGRSVRINRALALASGLFSVAFGAFLVYEIGIVNGLFIAHPIWAPK
jgi:high-affinity nickel-transport protein